MRRAINNNPVRFAVMFVLFLLFLVNYEKRLVQRVTSVVIPEIKDWWLNSRAGD